MSNEYYQLDFKRYLRAAWRQKWIVVTCLCISTVSALLIAKNRVPLYQASMSLWMREMGEREQGVMAEKIMRMFFIGQREPSETTYATQMEIIKSSLILKEVVKKLGLPSETKEMLRDSVRFIRNSISVSNISSITIVEIKALHPSPEMAIKIVNAVYDAYIEFNKKMNFEQEQRKLESMEVQARQIREEMGKSSDLITERIKNDMYLFLMNKTAEIRLNLSLGQLDWIKVIDNAETASLVPSLKRSFLLFLLGLMGVFLGIVLAIAVEAMVGSKKKGV